MVYDIEIFVDKNTPRSKWPLGHILKTFPNPKGFARSAIVKIYGSGGNVPFQKCVSLSQPQVKMISHLDINRLRILLLCCV